MPANHQSRYMDFLIRQFHEIRLGGFPVFHKKLDIFLWIFFWPLVLEPLLNLLAAPWAIPSVLIIRCLRPWRTVRFGCINSRSLGHFVQDVGMLQAVRHQQSDQYLDLYYFSDKVCNDFWGKMVQRNFLIYPRPLIRPVEAWNQILTGGAIHHIELPGSQLVFNRHNLFSPHSIASCLKKWSNWQEKIEANILSFLPEEDSHAKAWLRRQGWQDGEPFVCLLVRDQDYHGGGKNILRDSDITTYVTAVEWLADQDVWVLRMGKQMAQPIPTNHPRVIDYAFHAEKSDFLDVWLFAHCNFCITTGSGADILSDIYLRPLLVLNFGTLKYFNSWANAMHVPKRLVWNESGTLVTWRECLDNTIAGTTHLRRILEQLTVIDLTPEEILIAVQEQWQRIEGTWVDSQTDLNRHHRFWESLKDHPDFLGEGFHNYIHPDSRLATTWLRMWGDAFLE